MRFGYAGNQEDDKTKKLWDHKPTVGLCSDDGVEVERTAEDDDTHDRQAHKHFIGHHLRRAAQATQ